MFGQDITATANGKGEKPKFTFDFSPSEKWRLQTYPQHTPLMLPLLGSPPSGFTTQALCGA